MIRWSLRNWDTNKKGNPIKQRVYRLRVWQESEHSLTFMNIHSKLFLFLPTPPTPDPSKEGNSVRRGRNSLIKKKRRGSYSLNTAMRKFLILASKFTLTVITLHKYFLIDMMINFCYNMFVRCAHHSIY